MTTLRARCAAAPIFRDRHMAVDSWYSVTDPAGRTYDFCSACCLLEYATLGALPSETRQKLISRACVENSVEEENLVPRAYAHAKDSVEPDGAGEVAA